MRRSFLNSIPQIEIAQYYKLLAGKTNFPILWQHNQPTFIPKDERIETRMPSFNDQTMILNRDGWRSRFCGTKVIPRKARKKLIEIFPTETHWVSQEYERHTALHSQATLLNHILLNSRGGDNSENNLVTACGPCQFGRNQWTIKEVGLRDPRQFQPIIDDWDGLISRTMSPCVHERALRPVDVSLQHEQLPTQKGRVAEYGDLLSGGSEAPPHTVMAMVNTAIAYARMGEGGRAEIALENGLRQVPDKGSAYFNKGLLQAEKNELAAAEKDLAKALAADPQMAQAAYNLCIINAKDRIDETVTWCRNASELRPQESKYALYPWLLSESGRRQERCHKELERDPRDVSTVQGCGDTSQRIRLRQHQDTPPCQAARLS